MNKKENTQQIRRTQSVRTHMEKSFGTFNVEKANAVNAEFIVSFEPERLQEKVDAPKTQVAEDAGQEIVKKFQSEVSFDKEEQTNLVFSQFHKMISQPEMAIVEGPQGRIIKEADPKETIEESKRDIVEVLPQEAATESEFIVALDSPSEYEINEKPNLETIQQAEPFVVVGVQDTPRQTDEEPKTIISYLRGIIGILDARDRNQIETKYIEISKTKNSRQGR